MKMTASRTSTATRNSSDIKRWPVELDSPLLLCFRYVICSLISRSTICVILDHVIPFCKTIMGCNE